MAAQIVRMLFLAEAESQQAVATLLFMQPVAGIYASPQLMQLSSILISVGSMPVMHKDDPVDGLVLCLSRLQSLAVYVDIGALAQQPVGKSFAHSETVFCGHDQPHQTEPMVMQVMIGAAAIMIPRPNTKKIFDHHN
jgi:hypothetical protein